MADTYGHDEAMRDDVQVARSALCRMVESSEDFYFDSPLVIEIMQALHRLEAADTRLLAAAEARIISLLAALAAVGHRTESGCATCTLDRACTSADGNGDWPCPPIPEEAPHD